MTESTANAPQYLQTLNPEQREAVDHFEGPVLVLAGAGSGKTRVLTVRVAHLIREYGVAPHQILAVTFTNKAAGEMRDRIRRLLGGREPEGMWVGTFHSFGASVMRRYADRIGYSPRFTIFDSDESLKVVKRVADRMGLEKKDWPPKLLRSEISKVKNRLLEPAEVARDADVTSDDYLATVADVYRAYQEEMRSQNALDFDDLIMRPVQLVRDHRDVLEALQRRFQFVLVDEYQDTNHAQNCLLEAIAREHSNLMVVGDPDQSIYRFRGADLGNILGFESDFPQARIIRLEQNYRSTSRILNAANAVIVNNTARKEKTLRPTKGEGEPIQVVQLPTDLDEARWIVENVEAQARDGRRLGEIALLYRTNAQSRVLEEALRRHGIPYQIVGGLTFYERREIKDVLAYLRLIANPQDAGAFERCVNYPRRGIGQTSQDRLFRWARKQGISPLEAARRADEVPNLPGRARNSLGEFVDMIQRLSARATIVDAGALIENVVAQAQVREALESEGPEAADRLDNVEALIASAMEFDPEEHTDELAGDDVEFTDLELFLQRVALVSAVDTHEDLEDTLTLMTLHASKGLEFPVVFLTGLEEGLFPHNRSYGDPEEMEEERRLFYVGLTRAEDRLFLTHASSRRRGGEVQRQRRSPFLDELPDSEVERVTPYQHRRGGHHRPRRRSGHHQVPSLGVEDFDQDTPDFVVGESVTHPEFGGGVLREIHGFGRDLKVVVDFGDPIGAKTLVARYAGLRRGYG